MRNQKLSKYYSANIIFVNTNKRDVIKTNKHKVKMLVVLIIGNNQFLLKIVNLQ